MEAYNIKGGIVIHYPLALFVILILNAYCCCGSTVLVEINTTNFMRDLLKMNFSFSFFMIHESNPYIQIRF